MAINSSAPRAVHLPQYFSPASLFLFCFISWGCADAMLVFSDSFVGGQVNNDTFVFMPTLFLIIFCFILIFYVCFASLCLREGQISRFAMSDFLFLIFGFAIMLSFCWPFSASYHSTLSVLFLFCILLFSWRCDCILFFCSSYSLLIFARVGGRATKERGGVPPCQLNHYLSY